MDKNDSNFNFPPYMNYDIGCDPIIGDPNMFNPCMQYEQAYMYYRYMTQQIEYKIKCKEYEKMCNSRSEKKKKKTTRYLAVYGSEGEIRTHDLSGMNRLL